MSNKPSDADRHEEPNIVASTSTLQGQEVTLLAPPRKRGRPRKERPIPPRQRVSIIAVAAVAPRLMDIRNAAAYLGCSSWTIRALVDGGKLAPVKLPAGANGEDLRRLLFDRRDLDQLVEQSKCSSSPAAPDNAAPR